VLLCNAPHNCKLCNGCSLVKLVARVWCGAKSSNWAIATQRSRLEIFVRPDNLPQTTTSKMVLQAIKYSREQLEILDQLKLPHQEEYDHVYSSTDAWHAIKDMRTRGAPAIAIVAALALAVEVTNMKLSSVAEEVQVFLLEKLDYLVTSRPTAVNLADAAGKLRKITEDAAAKQGATGESVRDAYVKAAEQMLVDDVSDNENIGKHGAEWIVKNSEAGKKGPVSMMTHCNTG
jgi:methylthioribose-1-phosphate isomerase